jgi:hypothetical protein
VKSVLVCEVSFRGCALTPVRAFCSRAPSAHKNSGADGGPVSPQCEHLSGPRLSATADFGLGYSDCSDGGRRSPTEPQPHPVQSTTRGQGAVLPDAGLGGFNCATLAGRRSCVIVVCYLWMLTSAPPPSGAFSVGTQGARERCPVGPSLLSKFNGAGTPPLGSSRRGFPLDTRRLIRAALAAKARLSRSSRLGFCEKKY